MGADSIIILLLFSGPAAVLGLVSLCGGDFISPMHAGVMLACAAAIISILYRSVMYGVLVLRWNRICSWLVVVLATIFLSIVHASYPATAWRASLTVGVLLLTFYLLFNVLAEKGNLFRIFSIISVATALLALIAVAQFFGLDIVPAKSRYAYDAFRSFRAYSVFGNSNLLADFLAIALPVCIGAALVAATARLRVLYISCSLITLACIIIAGARGAILGAAAGVGMLLIFHYIKSRRFNSILAASFLLLLIGAAVVFISTRPLEFKQDSIRARLLTWKISLKMIENNPITGVGMGQFSQNYLRYQADYFRDPEHKIEMPLVNLEKQRHAHNEYLQIAAETGIPGLLACFALAVAIISSIVRAGARNNDKSPFSAPLLGSFCSFLVVAFFSMPLRIPITEALLIILAACASSLSVADPEGARGARLRLPAFMAPLRVRIEAAVMIFLICALVFLSLAGEPFLSAYLTKIGRDELDAGMFESARTFCGRAIMVDSLNGDAAYCMGMAGLGLRHYDDAKIFFDIAQNTIDDPYLHFNYGRTYLGLGDTTGALSQFGVMEAMVPASYILKLRIANELETSGHGDLAREKYTQAITILREEAAKYPVSVELRVLLAECYFKIGDIANCRMSLAEALRLKPGDPVIRAKLKTMEDLERKLLR